MNVFIILFIIWIAISGLTIVLSIALFESACAKIKKEKEKYKELTHFKPSKAEQVIGLIKFFIFVLCPILHIWFLIPLLTHTEEVKDNIYSAIVIKLVKKES